MDDDDDEVPTCPLCLEELDATDRAVKACQCGYQVCLWCLHHIREQLSARCPACRTPYEEQNFKFAEVNPEQAAKEAKERATAKKERERREKIKAIERERARAVAVSQLKAKSNLKHARMLQKNLVYVIGLSLTLARQEVIRRADMFGKFGRIKRILVNRSHPFNADAPGGPSISAYVQYYRDCDASAAVRSMNNAVFDGREIRCAIATTKYCDVFTRNAAASDQNALFHCGNQHCMYYHSISPPELVLTREEVLARQLGPPPPAHLFFPDFRRTTPLPIPFHRPSPSLPLPINAPPNTSVSAAASAVPASRSLSSRAPAIPGSSAMSSVSFTSHGELSMSPPSNHGTPLSTPASAFGGQLGSLPLQPTALSSPRTHTQSDIAGRKPIMSPQPFSPSRSPERTPPASPTRRRSVPSLQRSPPVSESAPLSSSGRGASVLSGHGMGSATASASPFFSPPSSSAQLPSTAGWGSNHGRSSSRSPSRRVPSVSLDDLSRTKSRAQLRRSRDNAPPGFEDTLVPNVPAGPSRPPGFDIPSSNPPTARSPGLRDSTPSIPDAVAISAPPGFGPSPTISQGDGAVEAERNDVAAAWSQEASADEVFSTQERRSKRPVGQPGQRSGLISPGGTDSVPALAQLLAQRGKEAGVSAELQSTTGPLRLSDNSEQSPGRYGIGETPRATSSQLDSLFGSAAFPGAKLPHPTTVDHHEQTPQSSAYAFAFSVPLTRNSTSTPRPDIMATPRRNNSRFDFARREIPEGTNDTSVPSTSSLTRASLDSGNFGGSVEKSAVRTEGYSNMDMNRSFSTPSSVVSAVPQVARQSRSRFDFADASSPPKSQSPLHHTGHSDTALNGDSSGSAFDGPFAGLSTAEKLASLFQRAEWSGERLPPMPTNESRVDQMTSQRPDPESVASTHDHASGASPLSMGLSDSGNEQLNASVSRPHPIQFAPPGFKEATPGISPETTAVDKNTTTAGVATSVASGGSTIGISESTSSGQPEESLSSGTESMEEDRKRSRAQRKRDKKARQLREAAEKKVTDARTPRPIPVQDVEVSTTVKDQSRLSAPVSGLREIKNPSLGQVLSRTTETSKQLKPSKLTDDPSRFMSVSELEREVEAARAREAQLQDRLQELQRRIRSYDNVRT